MTTLRRRPHLPLAALALLALLPLLWLEGRQQAAAGPQTAVTFSHPAGSYNRDLSLHLRAAPGAEILFSRDGAIPMPETAVPYTAPIHLSAAAPAVTVIRARVRLPDGALGPVASASYVTGLGHDLPVLSLIADPADLWSDERGIIANDQGRGLEWERPSDVTLIDPAGPGFHVRAGLRLHGRGGRLIDKKAFRLYFRTEYGPARLDYDVFADPAALQSFNRLVIHNGGQDTSMPDTNWTLLRNQLVSELAFNIGLPAARSRPILLFLNGEPWGVYQLRERIDDDFLADHFGITAADMLDTPEEVTSDQIIIEGDRAHWDALLDFVETHDLSDPANAAIVATQIDLANFIDYNILQIYLANEDWPQHNTRLFRPRTPGGRWRWILWDTDRTMNWYPGTEVTRDMVAQAQMTEYPGTSGRQTVLLRGLLANPDFRNRFLARLATLLNTALRPEAVVAQIDALAAAIAPGIPYEQARWPVRWTTWPHNVEELRQFARQRPGYVRRHTIDNFGLAGTAVLSLNPPAAGQGSLQIEGVVIPARPWSGDYFLGTAVTVTAVPAPGFQFDGWQEHPNAPNPITRPIDAPQTLTPRFR